VSSQSVEAHREAAPDQIRCAVLTVSDTRTAETDQSGDIIRETLGWRGHAVKAYEVVPDEPDRIGALLQEWIDRADIQAILITGGTGIARRDSTYDVVSSMLTKRLDGFGELFRMLSFSEIGAAAMLSRAVAGVGEATVIFLMPGSANAVRLAMEKLIGPELAHVVFEVQK